MSSNKKLQQNQSLYLKQFFANYFQRKHMLQTISSFNNGLRVLESLIQSFQHTRNIKRIAKIEKVNKFQNTFSSDVERESLNINRILEDVYNRLLNIFENMKDSGQNQCQETFKNSCEVVKLTEDDELYEILNKYKSDYKRQKQERHKLEQEMNKLREQFSFFQGEKKTLLQQSHLSTKKIEALRQQNRALQEVTDSLKQQIQILEGERSEWESKAEEYANLQISSNQVNTENQLLVLKLQQSQSRQKQLNQKFNQLDSIIRLKIEQNQAKWHKVIQSKLNDKNIYSNPACRVFKEFIKGINKQNFLGNKN